MGRQASNPFPVYPVRQLHVGEWFTTRHSAFGAHDPGQGSTQRLLMHVWIDEQSEPKTHSGRQFGAVPIIFAWHAHCALLDTTWQTELGPQGVGTQGFSGRGFTVDSSIFGGRMTANKYLKKPVLLAIMLIERLIRTSWCLTGRGTTSSQRIAY